MAKKVEVDEYGYIPRYQNMSYPADARMYNDLQDKMSASKTCEAALKFCLKNLI